MDEHEVPGSCPLPARTAYTAREAVVVEDDAGNAFAARLTAALETLLADKGLLAPGEVEQEITKVQLRVHDSNADMRYLVLPMAPSGVTGCSEQDLASHVTRNMLIGTAIAPPSVGSDQGPPFWTGFKPTNKEGAGS